MIKEKIEIVIPTYNRAPYLDETLSYLLNSPIKDCKITIRDNGSTDDTPKVCEKYSKLFKNMSIIRNNTNIGGGANIIRAYEEATYPYVWVLADNDSLNFERCEDFIEAIESERYDTIICSSAQYTSNSNSFFNTPQEEPISEYIKQTNNKPDYLENPAKDLALLIEKHYFLITTCISTTIYKTSLIDSEILMKGYDYIRLIYPHYPLIAKVLNQNLLTYKTRNDIVFLQQNPDNYWGSSFDWYVHYLECSLLINDKQIRTFATQTIEGTYIKHITNHIINAKKQNEETLIDNLFRLIKIMYILNGKLKGILYIIYIILCYILPIRFIELLAKLKNYLNNI